MPDLVNVLNSTKSFSLTRQEPAEQYSFHFEMFDLTVTLK